MPGQGVQRRSFAAESPQGRIRPLRQLLRDLPGFLQTQYGGISGLFRRHILARRFAELRARLRDVQDVVNDLKGQADVEKCSIYKWDDNQYIFCWREFGLPVSTVFFYNWNQMRSTGKFFAIGDDGKMANTPAGALINKLSMAFYPLDAQPL